MKRTASVLDADGRPQERQPNVAIPGVLTLDVSINDRLVATLLRRAAASDIPQGAWDFVPLKDISVGECESVMTFMDERGFGVVKLGDIPETRDEYWMAEMHCADAPEGSGELSGQFGIHKDDGAAMCCNVNSFLMYTVNTAKGGNLQIYREGDESTLVGVVDTHPLPGHVRVVLMGGNVWHRPESIENGLRHLVVIQFMR